MAEQKNEQNKKNIYGDQGNEGQYGQGQYTSEGKPDPRSPQGQEIQDAIDAANNPHNPALPVNRERGYEVYSQNGPQPEEDFLDTQNSADEYGAQDQFGDVDGQDPYDNLDDESENPENRPTPRGDGLEDIEETEYGLAEPLAKPGDVSEKGRDADRFRTRGSQDQYGYQK